MSIKELGLAWIVVKDLKEALKFYTTIGMMVREVNEEHGWAELSGSDGGARLGIAQTNDRETVLPGENAVVTLTVENLAHALQELAQKGVSVFGEIIEIPGVVKMQMVKDPDGNCFQLVEMG